MPAKPKSSPAPKKARKPIPSRSKRKQKPKTKSICVECGEIWRGTEAMHLPLCTDSIRVITFRGNKTDKQMYEAALDYICRELTKWRDGCDCVINDSYCGGVSQWGHVIPQGSAAHLVYDLSNSFRQCQKHNEVHRRVQAPYYDWYKRTFGNTAYKMLVEAWQAKHDKPYLPELLMQYVKLYEKRFAYNGAWLADLVNDGYYGQIVREAFIKDGRI